MKGPTLSYKQEVGGSSPLPPTSIFKPLQERPARKPAPCDVSRRLAALLVNSPSDCAAGRGSGSREDLLHSPVPVRRHASLSGASSGRRICVHKWEGRSAQDRFSRRPAPGPRDAPGLAFWFGPLAPVGMKERKERMERTGSHGNGWEYTQCRPGCRNGNPSDCGVPVIGWLDRTPEPWRTY